MKKILGIIVCALIGFAMTFTASFVDADFTKTHDLCDFLLCGLAASAFIYLMWGHLFPKENEISRNE